MLHTSLPESHEQRKIEELLVRLSKVKPISAKPAERRGQEVGKSQFFGTAILSTSTSANRRKPQNECR